MNDREARLDRALEAQSPAARDPMFRIAVLMRRERQALRRRFAAGAAVALAAAVIAALGFGLLGEWVGSGPLREALLAAAAVALTAVLTARAIGGLPALRRLAARWWPGR